MNTEEKQNQLVDFVHSIRPDVKVVFLTSKKWTNTFAQSYGRGKRIEFTPLLFKYTLESCFCCALHELAHIVQWERLKEERHNRHFAEIRDELLKLYGTPEIAAANREKKSKSVSDYIEDLS